MLKERIGAVKIYTVYASTLMDECREDGRMEGRKEEDREKRNEMKEKIFLYSNK
jgi:hypothetical protein